MRLTSLLAVVVCLFVCIFQLSTTVQLPPEVWLRFSTFNCSITYIMVQPNGLVSIRAMGDVGHMGYDNLTFSGLHGLNW